jgi:hypothetical protein
MNKTMIVALLAAAGTASVALGDVRETATFPGPINSNGRLGSTFNAPPVTFTATGTWDNAGTPTAYTVQQLVFGGTSTTGTGITFFPNEASVLVTPPSGTPFIIQPRRGGTSPSTLSGMVTIPVAPIAPAGTWTFTFFEIWDDGFSSAISDSAVDSIWTDVTIGLDDSVPVTGANPGPLDNVALTNILSDGLATSGFVTTGFTISGSSNQASAVRITGTATSLAVNPAVNTTTNAVANMRFALVRPDGGVSATVTPTFAGIGGPTPGTAGASSSTFSAVVSLPAVQSVNGDWVLRSFQTTDFPGGADVHMRNVTVSMIGPPPATAISPVDGGAWASATGNIASPGGVQWFTFTTPVFGTGGALDIDTVGSNLSPDNDTSIGLYTGGGALLDADNDDSSGLLSQLSYGSGNRLATGDGVRFGGQDGSTSGTTGNVGSSTQYWLAVAGGNGTYGAGFTTPITGANTGPVTARVRVWTTAAPTDPFVPPTTIEQNFGTLGNTVVTNTATYAAASFKWFQFTTPEEASAATGKYVDIWTLADAFLGTNTFQNDTQIGLYRSLGTLVTSDDQSGGNNLSALTFGDGTTPRTTGDANTAVLDGNDGVLAPDTYYLAVGGWVMTFGTGFAVSSTGDDSGPVTVKIGSNFAPSCICCNASNVAGPNQSTTPDNELTADDIIVFLGWYFANDPRANVAGPNQSTTPDNELTADDIIVFLGRYFTGC